MVTMTTLYGIAYSLSYVMASFVNFIEQNLLTESRAISCTLLVVELL